MQSTQGTSTVVQATAAGVAAPACTMQTCWWQAWLAWGCMMLLMLQILMVMVGGQQAQEAMALQLTAAEQQDRATGACWHIPVSAHGACIYN